MCIRDSISTKITIIIWYIRWTFVKFYNSVYNINDIIPDTMNNLFYVGWHNIVWVSRSTEVDTLLFYGCEQCGDTHE